MRICATKDCENRALMGSIDGVPEKFCARCNERADDGERQQRRRSLSRPTHASRLERWLHAQAERGDEDEGSDR